MFLEIFRSMETKSDEKNKSLLFVLKDPCDFDVDWIYVKNCIILCFNLYMDVGHEPTKRYNGTEIAKDWTHGY